MTEIIKDDNPNLYINEGCHWCGKETINGNYCSPLCWVQHDRRFPHFMKEIGATEDMTDEEIIKLIEWEYDEDGSVKCMKYKVTI